MSTRMVSYVHVWLGVLGHTRLVRPIICSACTSGLGESIGRGSLSVLAISRNMAGIGFAACPHCYLCGGVGRLVHAHLEDRLFGAPGAWNLKECSDKECGLVWLDPMPLLEDLPKAYTHYYTHGEKELRSGRLRDLYRQVKLAHLARALRYRSESVGLTATSLSKLLWFFP
jgi:hypothetical protein